MNETASIATHSAASDFDFLVGKWNSKQRRLKRRLQQCEEWETFDAVMENEKLPGGCANFDTMSADAWKPGWIGMSFRVFNAATNLWSIYWFTNEGGGLSKAGLLDPPVVGGFDGNVGRFYGDDLFDSKPIRVRYQWDVIDANTARWQQAFSPDDGRTWEVNWIMDFERIRAPTSI
jgi:hypothetical protein